jgi:hypothetical protein
LDRAIRCPVVRGLGWIALGEGVDLPGDARTARATINGIAVAPDQYVPLTAADHSAGRDPALTTDLTLLGK